MNGTATNNIGDGLTKVLSEVPFVIIAICVTGNAISFVIFRFHSQFKSLSPMVYLSVLACTDTLTVFVWNIDHHFEIYNYNFKVENISELMCRLATFCQYFSLESSAFILSMVSIDRYFTVISKPGSLVSRLPFRTKKSAFIWSFVVLAITAAINFHLLVLERLHVDVYVKDVANTTRHEKTFDCYKYANGFHPYPNWENVHLILYDLIPFLVMFTFNMLLIKNLLAVRRKVDPIVGINWTFGNAKKNRLTVSLLVFTFVFLLMTLPTTIMFGFFPDGINRNVMLLFDYMTFLNHSSLFFISMITIPKFKVIFLQSIGKIFARISAICMKNNKTEPDHSNGSTGATSALVDLIRRRNSKY